jgi:hypothetical protein
MRKTPNPTAGTTNGVKQAVVSHPHFAKLVGFSPVRFAAEDDLGLDPLPVSCRYVGPNSLRSERPAVKQAKIRSSHRDPSASPSGRERDPRASLGAVGVQSGEFRRCEKSDRCFFLTAVRPLARHGFATPAGPPVQPRELRLAQRCLHQERTPRPYREFWPRAKQGSTFLWTAGLTAGNRRFVT